jgi:hypothetical protein
MPWRAYDSGSVTASPMLGVQQTGVGKRIEQAAGQGLLDSENAFTSMCAGVLILLAFAAFLNEMTDFIVGLVRCIENNPGASVHAISSCASSSFKKWWVGVSSTGLQTVVSHWIDLCDWSLQLFLFFYVIGPATGLLWKTQSHQSAASLGFVVDRRGGAAVEVEDDFDEHWLEVTDFLTELFERGSTLTPEAVGRLPPEGYVGGIDLKQWCDVIEGDDVPAAQGGATASGQEARKARFPGRPRGTWAQIEEMTQHLLDPYSAKVRVYKGTLSWLKDERLLAVYPERPRMPCVAKVKAIITCGLDYVLHYSRTRREAAMVLTDRRLIQISAQASRMRRSLKIDMYAIGGYVKYLSFSPPRRMCCRVPAGRIALASRCGTLELVLSRMRTSNTQTQAKQFWQGLTLLQDAPPLSSQEFGSFATVESEQQVDLDDEEAEAFQEALNMWGRPSAFGTRPSVGARTSEARTSVQRLSDPRARPSANSLNANVGGEADVLDFGVRNEPWGLVLDEGEVALWGPTLFEDEIWIPCCCPNRSRGFRTPTTLVTITTRRLAVVQFYSWGPIWCGGMCRRTMITSVSVVPLRWVLGFCVAEDFSLQRAMFTRLLGHLCCRPNNESRLLIQILTNAGLGKVYLNSLSVRQRLLPRSSEPRSAFEEDKVLELRRWLGNVALFFVDIEDPTRKRIQIDLWRCAHGLTPG